MSMHNDLLQSIRAWVQLATGYDAEHVIPSNDFGTRPTIPYITISVTVYNLQQGQDEPLRYQDSGDTVQIIEGDREATISIQGYGRDSAEAIEAIADTYQTDAINDLLSSEGIVVIDPGAPRYVPVMLDLAYEQRFIIEPRVAYRTATAPVTMIPVEVIETTTDLIGLSGTLTIDINHTV